MNREPAEKPPLRRQASLGRELYRAFERLDAPVELLAIIGSIGDTLSDQECANLLKDYNDDGVYLYARH